MATAVSAATVAIAVRAAIPATVASAVIPATVESVVIPAIVAHPATKEHNILGWENIMPALPT